MAKRSQRRPVRYEKDQAGCIWGLISIFDFRHNRTTRKLISDKRRGSSRHTAGAGYPKTKLNMLTNFNEKCQSIDDGEENETAANAVKASVKELMEEEMFSEQGSKKQTNIVEVELEQSNSEHGGQVRKNRKGTNKPCKKSCDLDTATNFGPENSRCQVSDQKTSNNLDVEVIMEELCHQIHQKSPSCVKHDWHDSLDTQSNQAYSVFEEKLSAAIKVFINQRFTNGKHLTEDGRTQHSKEFMDALQTLSSNKELFLKLLQDPNSLLVKQIQDLEDAQLDKDQNSNSLVGSNLLEEELSNSRPDEFVNRKHRNFFRRRNKSQESISLRGNERCQTSSRIVILKPGPGGLQGNLDTKVTANTSLQSRYTMENKGQSERNASQFSFTEIKRKLKHAVGKERRVISPNGTSHRFPNERQSLGDSEKGAGGENGSWGSPNRNHFYTERFSKPSMGVKRGDKIGKSKDAETSMVNETPGYLKQGVSDIYVEAKKHLSEMLSNGDENAELTSGQLPKTLGRILSLPEYNFSPSFSPGKDREHSFVTEQMRLPPCNNFHVVDENTWQLIQENHAVNVGPSSQNLEGESCIIDDNLDDKLRVPNPNPDVSYKPNHDSSVEETPSSMRDEMNSEGFVELLKTTDIIYQGDSKDLDVSCEPSSSSITRDVQSCDIAEICEEERSSECLKLDLLEEDQLLSSPSASPSSSSVIRKVEDPESAIDRTERPSPVSVLEPLFTEDDISPASTVSRHVEPAIQPLQIHFEERLSSATDQEICIRTCMEDEESTFEYVEAVLLGSGLNWDEFLLSWLSSNQLLDPSLFDEVELFSNRSCHDQKLLFDCTNEVLKEVCEHYFGCFYGVSFVKQNIRPVPKGMDLIREVWKGVEWHILLQPPPHTLDQLLRKDMARSGTWMNLQIDTELIGIEMGESILEELMEDTILSFVNDDSEGEFVVLPAELNDN